MNLFVARLNSSTSTKDLHQLFSHYGLVTASKIIFDRFSGRSKCYGFIEMPNNHEAHEALKELDETIFQDNMISVRESQPFEWNIPEVGSGYRYRNSTANFSRNNNHHENKRNPFSINKTHREDNSLRNFGYRGSGYRTFR